MNNQENFQKIANTYGYDAQSRQCIEEMAELTQAINKYWRKQLDYGNHNILDVAVGNSEEKNLVEEIADVQIMLWQMAYLLDADVQPIIEEKLNRQLERIEKIE